MSLKQIGRRIEKLEESTGVNIPGQAEEVLRHWAETGEFGLQDGRPVPLAVFDEIMHGPDRSSATGETSTPREGTPGRCSEALSDD